MRLLLDTPLLRIDDPSLLALIRELEHASKVKPASHYTLYKYVWQCVYPWGADKRYPIDKNRIIPGGLLSSKIKKRQGTQIYQFCHDLAMMMQNESAEAVENMTLYVFLNRYLPDLDMKQKPKPFDPRDIM